MSVALKNNYVTDGDLTGIDGSFDAVTVDVTIGGDVHFDNDDVNLGTGDWNVSGNWDSLDLDLLSYSTARLIMDGAGKTLKLKNAATLYNLEIQGTVEIPATGGDRLDIANQLNLNGGTLTITAGKTLRLTADAELVGTGGTLAGAGTLEIYGPAAAKGITQHPGTVTIANLSIVSPNAAAELAAGTYSGTAIVVSTGGTFTQTGDISCASVEIQSGVTYDPNQKNTTTTGGHVLQVGALIVGDADAMNGATFIVGGDWTWSGIGGSHLALAATAAWTLTVTGTATAEYVDVAYSNASAGSTVDARVGCTNNSNNVNWSFIAGPYRVERVAVYGSGFAADGEAWEDFPVYVLARLTGPDGSLLKMADVATIDLAAFDLDFNNDQTHGDTVTDTSMVMFDAAQDDALWPYDDSGYNLRIMFPAAAFPRGGHKYRLELTLNPSSGSSDKFPIVHDLVPGNLI